MRAFGLKTLGAAALLIDLSIIFGDIDTSPSGVLKAMLGSRRTSQELVYGSIS